MAEHPHDMFDDVPPELVRVGAHRAPRRRRSPWWTFLWAAIATLVIVGAGVLAYNFTSAGSVFATLSPIGTASATPAQTVEPITDPADIDEDRGITIAILNGTTTSGLEQIAEGQLAGEGWPVSAATEAESERADTTVVYYAEAADEDVARGVAIALGVGTVQLTDAASEAPITVVLGADYADAHAGD